MAVFAKLLAYNIILIIGASNFLSFYNMFSANPGDLSLDISFLSNFKYLTTSTLLIISLPSLLFLSWKNYARLLLALFLGALVLSTFLLPLSIKSHLFSTVFKFAGVYMAALFFGNFYLLKQLSSAIAYIKLFNLRNHLAKKEGLPLYRIFTDQTLKLLIEQKPTSRKEFLEVSKFLTHYHFKWFGQEVLDIFKKEIYKKNINELKIITKNFKIKNSIIRKIAKKKPSTKKELTSIINEELYEEIGISIIKLFNPKFKDNKLLLKINDSNIKRTLLTIENLNVSHEDKKYYFKKFTQKLLGNDFKLIPMEKIINDKRFSNYKNPYFDFLSIDNTTQEEILIKCIFSLDAKEYNASRFQSDINKAKESNLRLIIVSNQKIPSTINSIARQNTDSVYRLIDRTQIKKMLNV